MSKARRFPIFFKILLACAVLAGLLVTGSFVFTKYQIEQQGRGKYLAKHAARYRMYEQSVGEAIGAMTRLLAQDDEIAAAVLAARSEATDAPSPRPQPPRKEGEEGTDARPGRDPAAVDPSAAKRNVERIAERKIQRMRAALGGVLRVRDPEVGDSPRPPRVPDIFVVLDSTGRALFLDAVKGTRLAASDLASMAAVQEILHGNAYSSRLVAHDGQVFQAAGVPILGPNDAVVGGVLIGVSLERYFYDYRLQSDEALPKQHRLSLVNDEQVLGSVFDTNRPELFAAVTRPKKRSVKDGAELIEVVDFQGEAWDFWDEPVSGFSDDAYTERLGTLYLMRTRAEVTQDEQMATLAFAAALGLILALAIASGLAFIVTRPIKRYIVATRQIALGKGDLTKRIEIHGNDELTDLAHNVNRIFENLHRVAQEVQEASMHVSSVSAELSAVSRSMNDGAKGQSDKLADAAARVYELSRSISEVAGNATDATEAARQADHAVGEADRKMGQIQRTSDDARTHMQDLGESVKRIGNIVEVIQKISEQTSMLALNASIEAAHAGEHGRGFAVVAAEVSSLAHRVGQSARDIEERIGAIREQTTDAVRKMEDGGREVQEGTELVTATLANLKRIIESVQSTARQVDEQARVSDDVSRDVDEVKRFAGEVLSSSEQVLSEGDRLHRLAEQLTQSVRGFRTQAESAHAALEGLPALQQTTDVPHAATELE